MMSKRAAATVLRAAVSAALLFWLYRRQDFSVLLECFRGMAWQPLAAFFALLTLNTWLSSVKWLLLLRADGLTHVRLRSLFATYFISSFFSMFLPSTIGGDAYRVLNVARDGVKPARVVASVFADRLTGFLALAALAVAMGLADGASLVLAPLIILGALVLIAWLLHDQRLIRRLMGLARMEKIERLARFSNRFLDSMAAYRRTSLLAQVMGLSFFFQLVVILAVWCLGRALALDVPLAQFGRFVPLVSLLEALPITVYGIGLRDSLYVWFFTRSGYAKEAAAALALLYVAATLVYVSFGGLLFIVRGRGRPAMPVEETK